MNRKTLLVSVAFLLLTLTFGCSGGGGGGEGEGEGEGAGTQSGTSIDASLSKARESLAAGAIAKAKAAYTDVINANIPAQTTKAIDPRTLESRVGRAVCNIILLMESEPVTAMLAGFGQSPWPVNSIFSGIGYLARSSEDARNTYDDHPFSNIEDCKNYKHIKGFSNRCLLSHVASGYTTKSFTKSLLDLEGNLDAVIGDLEIAVGESGTTFTIPAGLYSGNIDIILGHSDIVLLLAGMYAAKASVELANSWTFDLDLSALFDVQGKFLMTKAQLVDQLNSEEQFSLKPDNRIESARDNTSKSLDYIAQGLEEILHGASVGVVTIREDIGPLYQELYDGIVAARSSFEGSKPLTGMLPMIEVNLQQLFSSPPNRASITSDPFVLEGRKIKPVEAFWQQYISGVTDFHFGEHGIKIFSATTRLLKSPYKKIFTPIINTHFGKWGKWCGAGDSPQLCR